MRWCWMTERKFLQVFRKKKEKTIGLALGSGGAKGMAHLGALQAFAENGIVFDVFAGTSAGAIVGALSARGYSSQDIVGLMTGSVYGGAVLGAMLKGSLEPVVPVVDDALGGCDISELEKPFCAIVTKVSDGTQRILTEGNAARAVLASSSMPPLFQGLEIDGEKYADGAFCNAIPGDAARMLGADLVIGIALSPAESYRETQFATADGGRKTIRQTGFEKCDILLEPDLKDFKAIDIQYGAQMYDIGYACAQDRMGEILRAIHGGKARQAAH